MGRPPDQSAVVGAGSGESRRERTVGGLDADQTSAVDALTPARAPDGLPPGRDRCGHPRPPRCTQ